MKLFFGLLINENPFSAFFSAVPTLFSGFSFRDVIDILLLSAIVFFLVTFLREKRAQGSLIGIFIWGLIYIVSRLLRLTAVSTVLGSLFSLGVLALVVIFQPELRDMLGRIGTDSFRNLRSTLSPEKHNNQLLQDESLDAVAQAVSELSRIRTGALIVFEKNDQLTDVVRSGIEIDAKVSPYLIRNIFFDKSPLHDGALVIRDRRICAAGCLLQLSRRSDLDPSLGTRHRAAIGMSESSDAITIVVSEETGIISVAYRRQITRNFNYTSLKAFLYKAMLNQTDEESADEAGEGELHEAN